MVLHKSLTSDSGLAWLITEEFVSVKFFYITAALSLEHNLIVINKFNYGGKRCEWNERRNRGVFLQILIREKMEEASYETEFLNCLVILKQFGGIGE